MQGRQLILIIFAGVAVIVVAAILSEVFAGAPPTVPPDATPTARVTVTRTPS